MIWNPVQQMADDDDIQEPVKPAAGGAKPVMSAYDPDADDRPGPAWIERMTEIDKDLWIPGRGPMPCSMMVVGNYVKPGDRLSGYAFSSEDWKIVLDTMREAGFAPERAYMTCCCKFTPIKKKPSASEYKENAKLLDNEIRRVQPKFVIAMGADAFKQLTGKKITDMRMAEVPHIRYPEVTVIGTYDPQMLMHDARAKPGVLADWRVLAARQQGRSTTVKMPEYRIISSGFEAAHYLQEQMKKPSRNAAVDCEWGGENWQDPDGFLRCIQLAVSTSEVVVFELYDAGKVPVITAHAQEHAAFAKVLKAYLEDPNTRVCGHNAIADGEWLREKYDIDLRIRTVWDTMIAEHVLDSAGTFNLSYLVEKYFPEYGKYDTALSAWTEQNADKMISGYGEVPRELLLPYAAYDALFTFMIATKQRPLLQTQGMLEPRGHKKQYPSLMDSGLGCQRVLYEMQKEGLGIDPDRLKLLTDMYAEKMEELRGTLITMAAEHGMENFNPGSPKQCTELLFDKLKLTPVHATAAFNGMRWDDVLQESPERQKIITPSTDKTTLDILQDKHPIVKMLRDFRKVDYAVKMWLVPDSLYDPKVHTVSSSGGGLRAKQWPDGRIHTVYSQLKETSRLSCIHGSTLIPTRRGLIRADMLKVGDEVWTHRERWQPVVRLIQKPTQEMWRLEFSNGYILECTEEHKLLTDSGKWISVRHGILQETLQRPCTAEEERRPLSQLLADYGRDQKRARNLVADRAGCTPRRDTAKRIRCTPEVKVLDLQDRRSQPNEGEAPTNVQRRLRRRLRVSYPGSGSKTVFRASSSFCGDAGGTPERTTADTSGSSHRWRPEEQPSRQPGIVHDSGAQRDAPAGEAVEYGVRIARAVLSGSSAVFDFEVAEDHSYYCAGAFSHNSQKPNVQNFPKRAEGDIERIFGENKPPDIRTVFVPRPGWQLIEIDWTQAELFTLAGLSEDQNMWDALNTPGKDLHDLTALDSFSIEMKDPEGMTITTEYLVELAARDPKAHKDLLNVLTYVDQRGNVMDRATFKNTIRVSAKNVNFGIPYGRSAAAIAVQVKAETGTAKTIEELTLELEIVVRTWKTKTYAKAWSYLTRAADSAVNLGYVENAWGRRRLFPQAPGTNINAIRREAQNFPIQSTVADTCLIAMDLIQRIRDKYKLQYRIVNQVHDAIIFEAPPEEVKAAIDIGKTVMAGIQIPIIGRTPLQIGVDVDVMPHRWGEKA